MGRANLAQREIERGVRQPVPLNGGVAVTVAGIENLTILYEQQRLNHQFRDIFETRVCALGPPGLK